MTRWLHLTRDRWVTRAGANDAAERVTAFFNTSVGVQLVGPARQNGQADLQIVKPIARRIHFTKNRASSVLLLHPEEPQMRSITDGHYDYADSGCIIPWSTHRLLRAWLATQKTAGDPLDNTHPTVNPVVAQALQTIAHHRNPSSGIGYGYGKDGAVDALRKLRAASYTINPPALEEAAFQAGLWWDEVAQLRTYADGLASGRRFVTRSEPWKPNIVELWVADAALVGASTN